MRWVTIQNSLAHDAYDDLYSPGWRTVVAGRAAVKRERFAELYGSGPSGVIESPADLTMREVIGLKERFEAGEMTPAEAGWLEGLVSVSHPVLPEGPYAVD